MKNLIIWLALFLLMATSFGAFYGGYHLVKYPDGGSLKLTLDTLKHTPFKNFLIPGILLFISVGILGSLAIVVTFFQVSYYPKYIQAAGLVLTVWMLVQMALSPVIYPVHYLVLGIGIAQLLCGLALDRKDEQQMQET